MNDPGNYYLNPAGTRIRFVVAVTEERVPIEVPRKVAFLMYRFPGLELIPNRDGTPIRLCSGTHFRKESGGGEIIGMAMYGLDSREFLLNQDSVLFGFGQALPRMEHGWACYTEGYQ